MKISNLITKDNIAVGLEAKNKDDLLRKLVNIAAKSSKINDQDHLLQLLKEREAKQSTGSNGWAIPHKLYSGINEVTGALATLSAPVDYHSNDKHPVEIALLVVGKEDSVGRVIRFLSKVSRILTTEENKEKLLECKSADDVFQILNNLEANE